MTTEMLRQAERGMLATHATELRVLDTHTLRGPNVWMLAPTIVADVHVGELAAQSPEAAGDAMHRLLAALPQLREEPAPASWGALLVRVTLELQHLAGAPVLAGHVAKGEPGDPRCTVVVGYDDEDLGHDALHTAARVIRDCLRGDDPELVDTIAELSCVYQSRARDHGVRAPSIPVIAVTGTNGKTTTTRLIAYLVRASGKRVGYTTTDGVYVNDELLLAGDLTGPFAAEQVLSRPDVEVAVLETARGGILRAGLGVDQLDVGVVTNVAGDHLGLGGIETIEQLANVKAVIPSVVKPTGFAVLNADDPLTYAMRERTPGRVVLFSMRPVGASAHVEEHLARGGIVTRVEPSEDGDRFVVREGERHVMLPRVADVPLTFEGRARFQVENVLAAVAAAYAYGLSAPAISDALLHFRPSAAHTPGRLNVVETTRGTVIIDYGHNPAAVANLVEFMLAMPAARRFALLSAPGDRRDDDIREIGRLAARLDVVIPKEHDVYRRGREPGAINALITEGLLDANFPAERTRSFVEEHDAVAHLMTQMQPGDVAVVVADDRDGVMQVLSPYLRYGI